ncbi:MAG: RimJ/RimL family protein N-acetyltransferase [Planctomycetota bacterium]|nr:MAG: RimJ/RimL family protein N-acetyltransferase [Planctomycetota bacterium]
MIRLIQHTDCERIWKLIEKNRDYLRKWLPWLDWNTSKEDTKEFITNSLKDYVEKKSMVNVIVAEEVCGICSFNSINNSIKAGYIGYWIAENHQGKGLVTESCRDLETLGFEQLKLNKIEIHVAQENIQSQKVAEKLGYIETGKVIDAEWLYDHYVDYIIYCKRNPAN